MNRAVAAEFYDSGILLTGIRVGRRRQIAGDPGQPLVPGTGHRYRATTGRAARLL